jgi:putative transposase
MPWGLKRFHQTRQLHFITFSCYRRWRKLDAPDSRRVFERALEQTPLQYPNYRSES